MKKYKLNFSAVIFFFILLCGSSVVFGQGQQFLSVGTNRLEPILDGNLLEHSIYGDNAIRAWRNCRTPDMGIVGTPGVMAADRNGANSNSNYAVKTIDTAFFNTVDRPIAVQQNSAVRYYTKTSSTIGITATVMTGGGDAGWTAATNGRIMQSSQPLYTDANPVPTRRPKFPNVDEVFAGSLPPQQSASGTTLVPNHYGNLNVADNQTVTLTAGLYYFSGNVTIGNNAKLLIKANASGNFRTVMYINGRFSVAAGGTFAPNTFENCVLPASAACQIAVMVTSNGSVGNEIDQFHSSYNPNNRSAILFGPCDATVVGSFFAPKGEIFVQCGAVIHGQILANDIYFAYGYNTLPSPELPAVCNACTRRCSLPGGDFKFCSFQTANLSITAENQIFPEDKRWISGTGWGIPNPCSQPTYTSPPANLTWSATKNGDYDTSITVSLSAPLKASESITLPYTINANGIVATGRTSSLPQDPRTARVYVSSLTGNLTFNASNQTAKINNIRIIDFGDNRGDATFTITFSNPTFVGDVSVSAPAPITITIKTDDYSFTPSAPTLSQGRVIEYNERIGGNHTPAQAGTLSSVNDAGNCGTFGYTISSAVTADGRDVSSWFSIQSDDRIWTTTAYAANYENPDERTITFGVTGTYKRGNYTNQSDKAMLTLNISPWNDNAFEIQNVTKSVNEKGSVEIVHTDWFVSDADSLGTQNFPTQVGLIDTANPALLLGVWNNNDIGSSTITTPIGAKVNLYEDGTITYDHSTRTDANRNQPIDRFYVIARDTAKYGYPTDHFDRLVEVTINISIPCDYDNLPSKAEDYTMSVNELGITSNLIDGGGIVRISVVSISKDCDFTLDLGDSTKNGNLTFSRTDGTVTYRHENSSEFQDSFTYILTVVHSAGPITTTGKVRITIIEREPFFDGEAFYEDIGGSGVVNRVTIPFDKKVKLANTKFKVVFNTKELTAGTLSFVNGDEKVVAVELLNAPQNTTSGAMTVTAEHLGFAGNPTESTDAADMAAPVLIESAEYVKSLVVGQNDILIVKFAEDFNISVTGNNNPFRFAAAQTGSAYTGNMSFISRTINDNLCTLIVNTGNINVKDGDWIFINDTASNVISDAFGNKQKYETNKRVPINLRTIANITSAAYFDTNTYHDGYVDVIEVDVGVKITKPFAERILAALKLPPRFTEKKGTVVLNSAGTGFKFGVEETAKVNGDRNKFPPITFITEDDLLSLDEVLIDGALTIDVSKDIKPADSVAPVILYAIYRIPKGDVLDTTLDVVFSEPVDFVNGNPYSFHTKEPGGKPFTMTFKNGGSPTSIGDGTVLRYGVESVSIPFPVDGDSIWISQGGNISDTFDNIQDLTVRAPLVLENPYPENIILYVVPQPVQMVNVGGKRTQPKGLDRGFVDCYSVTGNTNGVAIVVEATGPVSDPKAHNVKNNFVRIFDQTGNAVTDNIEMQFSYKKCGDNPGALVGVAVWDGKNRVGRTVGAGTYLALVQVEIAFDDRPNPEIRTYRRSIAVGVGGK